MIRLIQRRLIIPRGDTGTFSVPVLSSYNNGDVAVFSIIDPKTQCKVYNKLMYVTDSVISIRFEHGDTVNLPVGKFLWDIKFYQDPVIDEGQVVSGKEVNSYYAAFTMPECEVRQTGDNMLMADDSPGSTLTPQQINAINAALVALSEAVAKTELNVLHYPIIIDGEWNVWDANLEDYTTTGIEATGNGIASIEKTNTEGLVDTYTVNFTNGNFFNFTITNGDSGVYYGTIPPTNPNINVWIDPSGTNSLIEDYSITKEKLNSDLYTELSKPKYVTVDELLTTTNAVVTLGDVTITNPIAFSRQNNDSITIVDTVFHIQTETLFTPYALNSYFILPKFIGCAFINETGARAFISQGGANTVGNKCIGCSFSDIDYIKANYIQDCAFTSCTIQSYDTFLECPTSTVQARFITCNAEASCKSLVLAKKAVLYLSGTYEGNNTQENYRIRALSANIEFSSCWFEAEKLLNLTGGTTISNSSSLSFINCEANIDAIPTITITNPEYVSMYVIGGHMKPYNASSIFVDKTANQFLKFVGDFDRTTAIGYNNAIGGASSDDRQIATLADIGGISGYIVSSSNGIPSISFKANRHWSGIFLGYNALVYLYGNKDGSSFGLSGKVGNGNSPILTVDSETKIYTITGSRYQGFTFIPNIDARKYFSNVTIIQD